MRALGYTRRHTVDVAVPVEIVAVQEEVTSSPLKTVIVEPETSTLFRSNSQPCWKSRGVVPPIFVERRLDAAERSPAELRNLAPSIVTPE